MNLPANYPYGCSEAQISKSLREYADQIIASDAQINTVLQLTPLIVIGNTELQSRQTKRVTRVSVGLGILSVLIAAVALWISITNNIASSKSRSTELELLKEIERDLQLHSNLQMQQSELLKGIVQSKPGNAAAAEAKGSERK